MLARSSDGVDVAVHDLGGHDASGDGRTLLIAHATGFHGRAYAPLASELHDRFHTLAPDLRGHGTTPAPVDGDVEWSGFTDDVVAAAPPAGGPLVAFGHSMGGACLLLAAHRHPRLFARLVLFEPIALPADVAAATGRPLAALARRRRSTFPTLDDALANYASKPPMSAFDPAALRAYVTHGFAPTGEGTVRLRCDPELEAATFEAGERAGAWSLLAEIATPTVVVSGRSDAGAPAAFAAAIARRLPHATSLELAELDHFGPLADPATIAGVIAGA